VLLRSCVIAPLTVEARAGAERRIRDRPQGDALGSDRVLGEASASDRPREEAGTDPEPALALARLGRAED
jgi:hypothetical protein